MLVAAFLGLVLASLCYAVLSGDQVAAGRAASEEVILGVGFAVSGAMLLYAIVLTLDAAEALSGKHVNPQLDVAASVSHTLAGFVYPLLLLYIMLGITDYEDSRYGPHHGITAIDWFGFTLIALQLVMGWVVYPIRRRARSVGVWRSQGGAASVKRLGRWLLGVIFLCSTSFAVADAVADVCSTLPPVVPISSFSVMFATVSLLTMQLAGHRR
jgi:hypothetical protein